MHGLGLPELLIVVFLFAGIGLVGTALWVWALVDCLTKEPDAGNTKVAWAVVIAVTHFIGGLLYLLVRRPQRVAALGR